MKTSSTIGITKPNQIANELDSRENQRELLKRNMRVCKGKEDGGKKKGHMDQFYKHRASSRKISKILLS